MNNDDLSYIPRPIQKKLSKPISTFFISADLGQTTDYTAISITERISGGVNAYGFLNTFHLRHIERPARGTEYPEIIDRMIEIYRSPELEKKYKAVVIDLTGLGRPVYDMMRKVGFHESLYAISITGGNVVTHDRRIFNVPKRDLITNLQILFQNGTLQIAKGLKEADALVEELTNFQTKISDTGMDTYGARSGAHDDIVLSVAMDAWLANRETWDMGYDRVM